MGQKQAEKQELLWSPPLASPAGCSWLWLRNKLINEPANGGWGAGWQPSQAGWLGAAGMGARRCALPGFALISAARVGLGQAAGPGRSLPSLPFQHWALQCRLAA